MSGWNKHFPPKAWEGRAGFAQAAAKHKLLMLVLLVVMCLAASRGVMFLVYKLCVRLSLVQQGFLDSFYQWDCDWYYSIIEHGYDLVPTGHENLDAANWAFFPLMPLIIRFFTNICRMDVMEAAFLVNTFFFGIGLIMAGRYIWISHISLEEKDRKKIIAAFIFIMTFGMYSFYFSTLYTEAVYFCLLCCTLYYMEKESYVQMGICGALLSAARNTGILFCFVVLAQRIFKYIAGEKEGKKGVFDFISCNLKNRKLVLGVCLIPLGFFMYMFYLERWVGDGFAWLRIQKAWGRETGNGLYQFFSNLHTLESPKFYISILIIIFIYLLVRLTARKKYTELALGVINFIVPMLSSTMSMPRYAVANVVFVLAFCRELPYMNRWAKVFLVGVVCLIECTLLADWMQGKEYLT